MASEIRVDKINSLSGVGTVTLSPTGVVISGITTVQTLKVGTGVTASEDGDIFFTGVCTATTFAGSGANLTALPAANITGTLPAISAANLTNIPAANVTGTLPALTAANLTNIPAANIVGLATAGFERSGGFSSGTEMFDIWTLSSNASVTSSSGYITSNWVRANSYQATIGSAMTESSGIFTFPSTGIYEIIFCPQYVKTNSDSTRYTTTQIYKVISGTSTMICEAVSHISGMSGNTYSQAIGYSYFDVTDVSTHKIQFKCLTLTDTGVQIMQAHSSNHLYTFASFKKLADT